MIFDVYPSLCKESSKLKKKTSHLANARCLPQPQSPKSCTHIQDQHPTWEPRRRNGFDPVTHQDGKVKGWKRNRESSKLLKPNFKQEIVKKKLSSNKKTKSLWYGIMLLPWRMVWVRDRKQDTAGSRQMKMREVKEEQKRHFRIDRVVYVQSWWRWMVAF